MFVTFKSWQGDYENIANDILRKSERADTLREPN